MSSFLSIGIQINVLTNQLSEHALLFFDLALGVDGEVEFSTMASAAPAAFPGKGERTPQCHWRGSDPCLPQNTSA